MASWRVIAYCFFGLGLPEFRCLPGPPLALELGACGVRARPYGLYGGRPRCDHDAIVLHLVLGGSLLANKLSSRASSS